MTNASADIKMWKGKKVRRRKWLPGVYVCRPKGRNLCIVLHKPDGTEESFDAGFIRPFDADRSTERDWMVVGAQIVGSNNPDKNCARCAWRGECNVYHGGINLKYQCCENFDKEEES